jgi:hypothetical protein
MDDILVVWAAESSCCWSSGSGAQFPLPLNVKDFRILLQDQMFEIAFFSGWLIRGHKRNGRNEAFPLLSNRPF